MTGRETDHEKDERIRLLEYQAEFLRRELEVVNRRYQDIVYSAAWAMARPIKRLEDALHRLARKMKPARGSNAANISAAITPVVGENLEQQIAARIAAKMKRPARG